MQIFFFFPTLHSFTLYIHLHIPPKSALIPLSYVNEPSFGYVVMKGSKHKSSADNHRFCQLKKNTLLPVIIEVKDHHHHFSIRFSPCCAVGACGVGCFISLMALLQAFKCCSFFFFKNLLKSNAALQHMPQGEARCSQSRISV